MQGKITILTKALRYFYNYIRVRVTNLVSNFILYRNNVSFQNLSSNGLPYVMVARGGKFTIGKNFQMNNGIKGNPIGRAQPCILWVDKNAELIIGNNVGISQTALVCHHKITIGNHVKIGGNVCIYDTDFHALNPDLRKDPVLDMKNKIKKSVHICDNVFIGAHTTILKGVTIGENSVIGACSVVSKSIPANEIWVGNPAKFIKKISI